MIETVKQEESKDPNAMRPPRPIGLKQRQKKFQLLIVFSYTHHGAGTVLDSHLFEEYDSLEECKSAGNEAVKTFTSRGVGIYYSCVPVYRMV